MLRKELYDLVRPLKKEKIYQYPTHIVMFGNEEDEQHQYVYIFEEQIEQVLDFLIGKAQQITVTELGRVVARV